MNPYRLYMTNNNNLREYSLADVSTVSYIMAYFWFIGVAFWQVVPMRRDAVRQTVGRDSVKE